MDEITKKKLAQQQDNQYLAIGKFIVKFEHLFLAIKKKVEGFVGRSEKLLIILEVHSIRQTIDVLKKIIDYRTKDWNIDNPDRILYKDLIKDLNSMNQKRNSVIHTTWFIG